MIIRNQSTSFPRAMQFGIKYRISALIAMLFVLCFTQSVSAQRRMQQLDQQRTDEDASIKQYEDSVGGNFKSRLLFGGNFGGSFGSYSSYVIIQPMIGYQLTSSTVPGIGFTYIYWDITYQVPMANGNYKDQKQSSSTYGPIAYVRQKLAGALFAQAEYQGLSFQRYQYDINNQLKLNRFWSNSLYLGGGYASTGKARGPYILAMYDVLWKNDIYKSFYSSPINLRVGFMF